MAKLSKEEVLEKMKGGALLCYSEIHSTEFLSNPDLTPLQDELEKDIYVDLLAAGNLLPVDRFGGLQYYKYLGSKRD